MQSLSLTKHEIRVLLECVDGWFLEGQVTLADEAVLTKKLKDALQEIF